jgi:hypothetical protein
MKNPFPVVSLFRPFSLALTILLPLYASAWAAQSGDGKPYGGTSGIPAGWVGGPCTGAATNKTNDVLVAPKDHPWLTSSSFANDLGNISPRMAAVMKAVRETALDPRLLPNIKCRDAMGGRITYKENHSSLFYTVVRDNSVWTICLTEKNHEQIVAAKADPKIHQVDFLYHNPEEVLRIDGRDWKISRGGNVIGSGPITQ